MSIFVKHFKCFSTRKLFYVMLSLISSVFEKLANILTDSVTKSKRKATDIKNFKTPVYDQTYKFRIISTMSKLIILRISKITKKIFQCLLLNFSNDKSFGKNKHIPYQSIIFKLCNSTLMEFS